MAVKKFSKKVSKKTVKKSQVTSNHKTISLVVGIITVAILALAVFAFAQSNNYKTVLGEKTQTPQTQDK